VSTFGSYLEKDREIQNALSTPRLILAAVVKGGPQTDAQLREVAGLTAVDFGQALQLLADEGLVVAQPVKGGLLIEATRQGRTLAGA
jgi:hypothetical protein